MRSEWESKMRSFADELRSRTWDDMARDILTLTEASKPALQGRVS
jgi:hypothetical protein